MESILIADLNKLLSLHPYWKKLSDDQKIEIFNKAILNIPEIKLLYILPSTKSYENYDTYKTYFSSIKDSLTLDNEYLSLILKIVLSKIKLDIKTYTYEKPYVSILSSSLLNNIVLQNIYKITSTYRNILNYVVNLTSHPADTFSVPLQNTINYTTLYRIYDFISTKFTSTVKLTKIITSISSNFINIKPVITFVKNIKEAFKPQLSMNILLEICQSTTYKTNLTTTLLISPNYVTETKSSSIKTIINLLIS